MDPRNFVRNNTKHATDTNKQKHTQPPVLSVVAVVVAVAVLLLLLQLLVFRCGCVVRGGGGSFVRLFVFSCVHLLVCVGCWVLGTSCGATASYVVLCRVA